MPSSPEILKDDDVNISGTGRIDGRRLPIRIKFNFFEYKSIKHQTLPLRWLNTSGLRRFGLFWGMSRWFPTFKLGGPNVELVVVGNPPVDSFKFVFESDTINVFGDPPSVNVVAIIKIYVDERTNCYQ